MVKFRIWVEGTLRSYWAYFWYREVNGIGQTKSATNNFSSWQVGGIPAGAEIC